MRKTERLFCAAFDRRSIGVCFVQTKVARSCYRPFVFSGITGGRLPVEEASLPVAKATVGLSADVVDRFA